MNSLRSVISRKEMRDALLRSGYLLENRAESLLREQGYYVNANAAYPDPYTGKSRELDIYAMSAEPAGPEEYDYVFNVLLIECVNNSQPIAFITKEAQTGFLHHYDILFSGLPVKVCADKTGREWTSLADFLNMEKYHHYCEGRIATQYCSFIQKKGQKEWLAYHDEIHFEAFTKLFAAVQFYVTEHFNGWQFNSHENINVQIYYPLLLVQGDLIDIRPIKRGLRLVNSNHIQFRKSEIIDNEETTIQIDVVTERFFPRFLELLEEELRKIARLMRRRRVTIRKSVDKITQKARHLRSKEKIRKAMDF